MPKLILRATLCVALFIFTTRDITFAGVETYKDIINKSYSLSLQKDRLQARTILIGALSKEQKKAHHKKELEKALFRVSRLFYSERAQQSYESALSVVTTDRGIAMNKLNEALRLEPDNLQIELSIARLGLGQKDCDWAQQRVEKYQEQIDFDEELKLLAAQTLLCLDKLSEVEQVTKKELKKSDGLAMPWLTVRVEYLFRTNKLNEALKLIEPNESQKDFPELSYWRWRIETDLKLDSEAAGQAYLGNCKSLSSRSQRDFMLEPSLCMRTVEVETFLKKKNNTGR